MSETETQPAPDAAAPAPSEVTLHEFCVRLSVTDRRPELIGGFEFTERVAGRVKDTEAAFQSRYDAFVIKPV